MAKDKDSDLTWEQREELRFQEIGFRIVKTEYYGPFGWLRNVKSKETIQYFDTDTLTWLPLPVKYEVHSLEKA